MPEGRDKQRYSVLAHTTPVPNRLLDEVMPHLSDTQLRVLLVVVRSTLGWQEGNGRKERDWISHRQLQARTGRSSAVVSRAVESLVLQGLIRVTDASGRELAKASERSRSRGRVFYALKSSAVARETLPRKVRTTKETGTKEINTKGIKSRSNKDINFSALAYPTPSPSNPPCEFMDTVTAREFATVTIDFMTTFERHYRARRPGCAVPSITPEDHLVLDQLLKVYGAEELQSCLPCFFDCSFSYVTRSGYSLRSFLGSLKILRAISLQRR